MAYAQTFALNHTVCPYTLQYAGTCSSPSKLPFSWKNVVSWAHIRDVQEWLATFPSVHSHSHDASDLLSIPVPLQKFFPILSHSHLTNERHLLLNKR